MCSVSAATHFIILLIPVETMCVTGCVKKTLLYVAQNNVMLLCSSAEMVNSGLPVNEYPCQILQYIS